MKVRIEPSALAEVDEAREWYEKTREGLGDQFIDAFHAGLRQIADFPNAWQPLGRRARRYRLNRFPYGVVYQVRTDEILVVAVAHLHRRSSYWRRWRKP